MFKNMEHFLKENTAIALQILFTVLQLYRRVNYIYTADVGEEEAKKLGFFALSLMDLSLGTALSLQALCPADKTTYHIISQSCSVIPLYDLSLSISHYHNHACMKCIYSMNACM